MLTLYNARWIACHFSETPLPSLAVRASRKLQNRWCKIFVFVVVYDIPT